MGCAVVERLARSTCRCLVLGSIPTGVRFLALQPSSSIRCLKRQLPLGIRPSGAILRRVSRREQMQKSGMSLKTCYLSGKALFRSFCPTVLYGDENRCLPDEYLCFG